MSLFERDHSKLARRSESWWRAMSLSGWGLLFLAVFATVSFILGVVTGETLFLPSYASKSGPAEVSWASSPLLFVLAMVTNLAIGVGIWGAYSLWLTRRRGNTTNPAVFVSTSSIRASKYDPTTKTRKKVGSGDA
jgi:hypothetical protein